MFDWPGFVCAFIKISEIKRVENGELIRKESTYIVAQKGRKKKER